MTSKIYNCSCCLYNSTKKFNLNRHMLSKHSNIDINNTMVDVNNTIVDVNNTIVDVNNTMVDINNTIVDVNNTMVDNDDKKCPKCSKNLSSKNYLKKHLIICKGVLNSLECHKCHKILANSSSKFNHLKICKGIVNDLVILNNNNDLTLSNDISSTNQITINNNDNTINNNITNNTYNINLVAFDKFEEKINFDICHLDINIFYKLTTKHFDSAFYFFCMKLFENKNNQLIIKTNLKLSHSHIHLGLKVWTKIYDKYIYPIIMTNISETMLLFIDKYKYKSKNIDNLISYLDIMASNGYSSTKTAEFKTVYSIHINKLKLLFNTFINNS
jgi:hypothetical protein